MLSATPAEMHVPSHSERAVTGAATATSWILVFVVLAVQFVRPDGWDSLEFWPLVVGLLIGLPHGALDHLVPTWWLGRRAPVVIWFALAYGAAAAAAFLLFRTFPVAGIAIFLLLSAWHFACGETGFSDLRGGDPTAYAALRRLARAAVVLLLPAAVHPTQVADLITEITNKSFTVTAHLRTGALVFSLAAVFIGIGACLLAGRRLDAVELMLLVVLALSVSPLVAFGVYFGGWHSVRHLARSMLDDPANLPALAQGKWRAPLRRLALDAAGPTAIILVTLGLLWSLSDGWQGFVTTYLALLAGLTVPHMMVVAWADRRRLRRQ
ncbi:Brp/Blh family beta-carotene 15,15'-dioxygenase [Rhodococcoides yunnanense]|uniref:Probable beta-carotene 15,15'-dioxygenase n=1 Tax=Rhodococcoides yunnanense TaxID=278209 RepID=A0ABU4B8Z3_9NOCA|nr:Brp/Blh family beta-carotene 15,15'-dioxygenase [Rhodococcus yunnanensis]MDV6260603.1 Brp/Blh family beta-carotene 15,15'-dioxygenase [Rhodococcus yunnanensis]